MTLRSPCLLCDSAEQRRLTETVTTTAKVIRMTLLLVSSASDEGKEPCGG